MFPSVEAHNALDMRRSGKARRDVFCRAGIRGSVHRGRMMDLLGDPTI